MLLLLVVGVVLLVAGVFLSRPNVSIAGGLFALIHGVTTQVVLAFEGRTGHSSSGT